MPEFQHRNERSEVSMLEIDGHRRNQESEAKPKVDWSRQKKNAELISTFSKNSLKLFYFDFCAYFF